MKTALAGFLLFLVIGTCAVLMAPSLIDWSGQKDWIAAEIADATGWSVAIEGDLDMALLPTPRIAASGVRLAGSVGNGTRVDIALGAVEASAALLPLAMGSLEIDRIIVAAPTVAVGGGAAPSDPAAGDRWVRRLLATASMDRLTVEDGTLLISDPVSDDGPITLHRVGLQGTVESPRGPFRLAGGLVVDGVAVTLEARGGRYTDARTLPVTVAVDMADGSASGRFSGALGDDPLARGEIALTAPDLGAALPAINLVVLDGAVLSQPFDLRANVVAEPETVAINNLAFSLGGSAGDGAISIVRNDVTRMDTTLTVDRFDPGDVAGLLTVDPWPVLQRQGFADHLHLPEGWEGSIDLTVGVMPVGSGLVRQVQLEAAISGGILGVNRFGAQLPGGSDLILVGALRNVDGAPFLDTTVELTCSDLRGLLTWLDVDVEDVPQDRLRRLDASLTIAGRPGDFRVTGVDIDLDGSRFSGGLAFLDQGIPGIGLRFELDRLDLDAYRTGQPDQPQPPTPAQALDALQALARTVNANVHGHVGMLVADGVTWHDLAIDATLSGGRLTVRRGGIGAVAGTGATVVGVAGAVDPLSDMDLRFTLAADRDLSRFGALFGIDSPIDLTFFGPTRIDGEVSGDPDHLALSLAAVTAGGEATVDGVLIEQAGRPAFGGRIRLQHADLAALGRRLAASAWPPTGLGPLDLQARIVGSADRFTAADIAGRIGPVTVAGALDIDTGRPDVAGTLHLGSLVIDDWLSARLRWPFDPGGAWSRRPLAMALPAGLGMRLAVTAEAIAWGALTFERPSLILTVEGQGIAIDGMRSDLLDGRLDLSGRLTTGVPTTLSLDLDLVDADLQAFADEVIGTEGIGGRLSLSLDGRGSGRSIAEVVRGWHGEGRLSVRDAVAQDFNLGRIDDAVAAGFDPVAFVDVVRGAVASGRTAFAIIEAPFRIEAGTAESDRLRLVAEAGTGAGHATFDLADWLVDVEAAFALASVPDAPTFDIWLTGSPRLPERRLRTEALQAYVAARAAEALSDRYAPAAEEPPAPPAVDPGDSVEPPDPPGNGALLVPAE